MRHMLLLVVLVALTLIPSAGAESRSARGTGAADRAHESNDVSPVAGGARWRWDDVVHRVAESRGSHT
jgi:hypothetical protein